MREQLKDRLSSLAENRIQWDCPLAPYTSFGIGGPASALVTVESIAELLRLLQCLVENNLDWRVIGRGTNLLVADSGFAGVIFILGKGLSQIALQEEAESGQVLIRVGAGCSLARLLAWCMDEGLSGLEFVSGIPGSVGGAVVMNAGAWGGEMADVIVSLTTVSPYEGEKILGREELKFSYRLWENPEKSGAKSMVVAADLELRNGLKKEIAARCREYLQKRLQKQPKGLKNAGSFFKNPPGDSAGRLIEASGLKGTRCGGAMISAVHANFLVNSGQATAKDVLQLMELVREKVAKDSGITLETEVHFL
ncbi:MAG: UDP-N-acetylmuramate dehydrogenase [Proteobacteria bacterium]|nr:UDP-N-acetylmuramate dehydrogenase [Pseudomonadota bacterium]MBU1419152.1 UDP-N-acetylmuramate dehydrogenase [Pseudomonadota bacterium]MBU1455110.1 UDP-N-acetylmuramate dehydrogenase [Pseudomonadota bacterium]